MGKTYKHLGAISVLFVAVLLISNIASTKIVQFGALTFDGGTLLFPLAYIFDDVLTEVYGYARSRRVIWLGFACTALMALLLYIVQILPPAPDWGNQAAYDVILGQAPRIVLASLIAYLCGEFLNSFVLAKMKIATKGKWLWTRTIGSTLVGELVDSTLFILIAFAGVLPAELLYTLILSNYVFKTTVEVVLTPATYAVIGYLKRADGEDYYDRGTNFNPFAVNAQ
jgi:uncharacterized integral membrane protein (TIGR00697 family)